MKITIEAAQGEGGDVVLELIRGFLSVNGIPTTLDEGSPIKVLPTSPNSLDASLRSYKMMTVMAATISLEECKSKKAKPLKAQKFKFIMEDINLPGILPIEEF
jgi:hypothetical protein